MTLKKICSTTLLLVFLVAVVSLFLLIGQAAPKKPIYVTVSEVKNDTLTAEIFAPGLNWAAFDFRVLFDPAVLAVEDGGIQVGYILDELPRGQSITFVPGPITAANSTGVLSCTGVAPVGTDMSAYSGSLVLIQFRVLNESVMDTVLKLAVRSLIDSQNKPVADYTTFGQNDTPVIYESLSVQLRVPEPPTDTSTQETSSTDHPTVTTSTSTSTSTSTRTENPTDTDIPTDTDLSSSETETDLPPVTDTDTDWSHTTNLQDSDITDDSETDTVSGVFTREEPPQERKSFAYWPEVVSVGFAVLFVAGCAVLAFLRRR